MTLPAYKTALVTYAHTQPLKDGTVVPRTFTFDFEEVPVIIRAFRRMVRGLEFDVTEMAITTYLTREGARQALHRDAGVSDARVPSRRHPLQHEVGHQDAEGPRRPKGRRQSRLHRHHRACGRAASCSTSTAST